MTFVCQFHRRHSAQHYRCTREGKRSERINGPKRRLFAFERKTIDRLEQLCSLFFPSSSSGKMFAFSLTNQLNIEVKVRTKMQIAEMTRREEWWIRSRMETTVNSTNKSNWSKSQEEQMKAIYALASIVLHTLQKSTQMQISQMQRVLEAKCSEDIRIITWHTSYIEMRKCTSPTITTATTTPGNSAHLAKQYRPTSPPPLFVAWQKKSEKKIYSENEIDDQSV